MIIGILGDRDPEVRHHEGQGEAASIKTDLRNLMTAQAYFSDYATPRTSVH